MLEVLKNQNTDELINYLLKWKSFLMRLYPDGIVQDFSTNGMEYLFGTVHVKNVYCIKNANIDLNFSNVYKDGDLYCIIDYEYICKEYVPFNYVLAVSVFVLNLYSSCSKIVLDEYYILKKLGLKHSEIEAYKKMVTSQKYGAQKFRKSIRKNIRR